MGGKTLPQFSIPAAARRRGDAGPRASGVRGGRVRSSPGTTRVGRGDLVLEAARNVVRAAEPSPDGDPRALRDAIDALADSLVALDRSPSSIPPPPAVPVPPTPIAGTPSSVPPASARPSRPSEPGVHPTMELPAAVEAWWQIEASRRAGETRYVARWVESVGPDGAVVEEVVCDGLSESLQTVLGRRGDE